MREPYKSLTKIYHECLERQLHYDMFPHKESVCKDCPYNLGETELRDNHSIYSQTCMFERVFSGDKPYLWNLEEIRD
jgi:hypothetical protein